MAKFLLSAFGALVVALRHRTRVSDPAPMALLQHAEARRFYVRVSGAVS